MIGCMKRVPRARCKTRELPQPCGHSLLRLVNRTITVKITEKVLSRGAVAQLGERLVRNEEATGSIPVSSTIFKHLQTPKIQPVTLLSQ